MMGYSLETTVLPLELFSLEVLNVEYLLFRRLVDGLIEGNRKVKDGIEPSF